MNFRKEDLPSIYTANVSEDIFEDEDFINHTAASFELIPHGKEGSSSLSVPHTLTQTLTQPNANIATNRTSALCSLYAQMSNAYLLQYLDQGASRISILGARDSDEGQSRNMKKKPKQLYNNLIASLPKLQSENSLSNSVTRQQEIKEQENDCDVVESRPTNEEQQQQQQRQQLSQDYFVTTPLLAETFPEFGSTTPSTKEDLINSSTSSNTTLKRKKVVLDTCHEDVENKSPKKKRITRIQKSHETIQTVASTHLSNGNTTRKSSTKKERKRSNSLNVITSKVPRRNESAHPHSRQDNPYVQYKHILQNNNYTNVITFPSSSKYYSKVSNLQKASYGNAIIKAALNRDCTTLKNLISSGLSPNPSNSFGDSLMNIVCKRGYLDVFLTLIECGASIKTCDQSNRTPLHYATSNPCFDLVEKILEMDVDMLNAKDRFDKTPLEYVTDGLCMTQWNEFLMKNQDKFWPPYQNVILNVERNVATPLLLHMNEGCCCSEIKLQVLPDPDVALSENQAKMVSSGKVL